MERRQAMLILITNGTYGHSPLLPDGSKSRYVVPVNRKSGPIDVDPDEAKRLVEAGVAQYVNAEPTAETEKDIETPDAVEMEGMSFAQLKELANELGIDTGGIKSKASMIKAINDLTEEFPLLPPEDVVVE